ncbi:hypothetical protein [Parasphingorhabdus pacifica]
MDDGKLERLFQDAADSAPPAGFDAADVARSSRRVTARRRVAWAGGSLVAAAVLAGGVSLGIGAFDSSANNVASPPPTSESERAGSEAVPKSDGPGVLSEPGKRSCPPPDAELADALAGQLRVGDGDRATAAECAAEVRSASFVVRDAGESGEVAVLLHPADSGAQDSIEPGEVRNPDGTEEVTRQADSGRMLTVRSDPDAGSAPPLGPRLPSIADALAGEF